MPHECVPIHRRLVKRSATIETRHRRLYRLLSPDVLPQSADHPRMHAYLSKHDMEMNEKLSNEDTSYCIKNQIWMHHSFTFVLICFGVSVKNTAEFVSLADIFVLAPCSAGKNVEWMSAGLGNPRRGATSLVIRKYGSWSMAQGIKQCTFFSPNMNGNVDENAGAACTAGNAIFPIGSESPKPKIPFTWLNVTHFWMRIKFW